MLLAHDLELVKASDYDRFLARVMEVKRMLASLIGKVG
jgi:hypothetical protein